MIPTELLELPQWVTWKFETRKDKKGNEKITKVPYSVSSSRRASSTDPATWGTYQEALAGKEKYKRDGIGFVFAKDGVHAGVDLDGCRNPETGDLAAWALEIIERLNSYSEASPSGTGVHIYLRGVIEKAGRKKGDLEMYDDGRFFTVTGDHLPGTPETVEDRQLELMKLHREVFTAGVKSKVTAFPPVPTNLDDTALLDKAMNSKTGDKVKALWAGDYSAYAGIGKQGQQIDGRSEADLALCAILRFWTGGDAGQIDRLFRQSGLMRDKWDEKRGEATYGAKTIQKVLDRGGEVYSPGGGKPDQITFLTAVAEAEASGDPFAPEIQAPGIYVEHGGYYIDRPRKEKGETVEWIPEKLTNWIWTPTLELRWPDGSTGERGHLLINGIRHFEIELQAGAWNSRRDLLDAVGRYGAVCFTTNSADVAKIRQSIVLNFSDLPIATGVPSYGLHKVEGEWIGLYHDQTLCSAENPPIFYAGVQDKTGGEPFKCPPKYPKSDVEKAKTAIVKSLELMTQDSAMAILGYGAASAFGPRLTKLFKDKLPFVYVEGEKGTGKSSYAELALKMFMGLSNPQMRLKNVPRLTKYRYELAYSNANNMLAVLDEYKEGESVEYSELLREHHALGVVRKGTGKSGVLDVYHYNAPLIVLGEGLPTDPATRSRAAIYFPLAKDRGSPEAYGEVVDAPLEAFAFELHTLGRTMLDDEVKTLFRLAEDRAKEAIKITNNPRLQMALTYISFGLLVLQLNVSEVAFNDEKILDTLTSGSKNYLEGGTDTKTNLEVFLEQFAFALSATNPLQHENYFSVSPTGTQIVIRATQAVDLVKKTYRERSAIASSSALLRSAKEQPFFDKGDVHKIIASEKSIRGLKLDLTAIPEKCDASLLEKFHAENKERQELKTRSNDRYSYVGAN